MKSALSFLLASESASDVTTFLRKRGGRAHIVAPGWVRKQIGVPLTEPQDENSASWSEDAQEAAIGEGKTNVIVVAEDAERERAIVSSLATRKGRKVYGLFSDIFPALLCSTRAISAGKPTADLKRYAILCVPRSGSRYLSAVLNNRGIGAPKEHIRPPLAHIIAGGKLGFRNAIGSLEKFGQLNGIFGTKLISTFLIHASRGRVQELRSNTMWMVDRGYRLIRLNRPLNDAVISSYIAFLMRQWHFFGEITDAARDKLDTLEFEDGAAWDEFLRFRAEKIIVDSLAEQLGAASVEYSEIEQEIDSVVQRICKSIMVDAEQLAPGSAQIPFATRTVSPTYASFARRLAALLARRDSEVQAATVRKMRALTSLSQAEAEELVATFER